MNGFHAIAGLVFTCLKSEDSVRKIIEMHLMILDKKVS